MSVKSGQAVTVLFSTANATTGAATDATGTPTGTLYVNGTANGATVTVTNITTGVYKAAVTLPSLSAGDVVSLRAAATVSAVAGEGIIWQDVADTKRVSDLNDIAAGAEMGLANDAITAAKFDESTAFPLSLADTGATAVARVGADGDTLETLSDQIDAAALEATAQSILDDTAEIGAAGAGLTALASQASVNDLPTNSELTTALAAADDAVLAAIAALNNLSSAGAQAAAAAALAAYDAATGADISGLNDLSAAEVNAEVVDVLRTDTIPDSYAADGAQPTIAQAVLMLLQFLSERDVSGTTITVKKPDGATSAMTFTLDDSANPTSITRAS